MLYTHFPSKYASQFALSTFDEPYSALGETNEAVHEMFSDRTNRRTISAVALSSRAMSVIHRRGCDTQCFAGATTYFEWLFEQPILNTQPKPVPAAIRTRS
jgi:hypothetical protein